MLLKTFLLVSLFVSYGLALPQFPQFSLPSFSSFPSLSLSLPMPEISSSIFNPFGNDLLTEELTPKFGGFDKANVTTKNKTEVKDGYKIDTTDSFGPGYESHMTRIEPKDLKKVNGSNIFKLGTFTSGLMKGNNFFDMLLKPVKKNCSKPCKAGKYCNTRFGKCLKQLKAGRNCFIKDQCEKDLKCVWGKCNQADDGSVGTICENKADCIKAYCVKSLITENLECTLPLEEGAECGVLGGWKNKETYLPCKEGLKCAIVGNGFEKRCVTKNYQENAKEEQTEEKDYEEDQEKEENKDKEDDDDKNDEEDSEEEDKNETSGEEESEPDKAVDKQGRIEVQSPHKKKKGPSLETKKIRNHKKKKNQKSEKEKHLTF